jgi:hypothetical protein
MVAQKSSAVLIFGDDFCFDSKAVILSPKANGLILTAYHYFMLVAITIH